MVNPSSLAPGHPAARAPGTEAQREILPHVGTLSAADREIAINRIVAGGDLNGIDALARQLDPQTILAAAERYGSNEVKDHVAQAFGSSPEASHAISGNGNPRLSNVAPTDSVTYTDAQMTDASQRVYNADAELAAAKSEADELNKDFQKEMAELGPTLTDEQRRQYYTAFQQRHPETYERLAAAASALNDAMADPAFKAAVRNHHTGAVGGNAAMLAMHGLRSIAESGVDAGRAADWLVDMLEQSPDLKAWFLAGPDSSGGTDQLTDLATRLKQADATEAALNGQPVDKVLEDLADYADRMTKAGLGGAMLKETVSGLAELRTAARSGDVAALERAQGKLKSLEMPDSLKILSVVTAAIIFQDSPDGAARMAALATATGITTELMAKALSQFSATGAPMMELGSSAQVMGRAAGMLNVLAGALWLVADMSNAEPGSWGDSLVLSGDVSVLASAVSPLLGLGGVATVGMFGLGMLLCAIGASLRDGEKQDGRNNEKAAILETLGLDPGLGQVNFDGKHSLAVYERMRTEMGMSRAEANEVLAKYPDLAYGLYGPTILDAAKACNVPGGELLGFIDALVSAPHGQDLAGVTRTLSTRSRLAAAIPGATRWTMLAALRSGFPGAAAEYIDRRNPQLAEQLDSRLAADSEFGPALANSNAASILAGQIAAPGKDAHYKAEVIALILRFGTAGSSDGAAALDQLVALAVAQGDDKTKAALAEAIRAAYATEPGLVPIGTANAQLRALGAEPIAVPVVAGAQVAV